MAKDPPSPTGEEAAENAGPSRKESDPLFQQLGLKRRTTVIGLAPAPHLIAKAAANVAAAKSPHTGPPAPLHEEIEEPQLPPPAFGQTTMLMTPQTPAIPLSLPNPPVGGRAPDTDPTLPPDDGWGSGERQEQKPAGVESSPTILVEPPKGGSGSGGSTQNQNVVRGFGGRVTPQGIQPAQVGPRPNRSDPPTGGPVPGSEPPPNTQRHQNQNQNANAGGQTLNQNPPGQGPPQGQQQGQQQQPSTLHMKVAPSVSRQTQPLPPPNPNAGSPHSVMPNQPPQHQQQQPYRPPNQSNPSYPQQQAAAYQQTQPQPQIQPQQIHNIEPRRPTSSRPEPNEVIAEVVARHPSYPLMRTPVQPDWPPQQQNRALGERWKPRYPVVTGGDAPLGMATKQQVDGFRELRTRLQSIAAGTQRNVFTTLVVPLTSGSGGSFVARNLATAFAFGNERDAILVDCNIEKPTQHLMLRSRPDAGLFEFLEQPNSRPIDSIVQPTTIPRLHLIPAGSARLRFQEHFSSPQMRALIETIQSESFVFLDGPPAKGSPDARILSKLADFVILVVGYGKGTAEDVSQAAAMFEPTKFAGVVFNERE